MFVYDGWNLVEEIKVAGATETSRYFVWGLDLSQSSQGAGGIGGLIAAIDGADTYCFAYDGNGNVGQVIEASSGTIAASYQYDPFGNLIKSEGAYADDNPFRFSTKFQDDETGLIYYGFRYYSPSLGRWISRDPIEEDDGFLLYGFVTNRPLNYFDPNGLFMLPVIIDPNIDPAYREQNKHCQIQVALSFDVVIGLSAGATYDNAVRVSYDIAENKLKSGINKLVNRGVISIEEGAKLYVTERNKLVKLFRQRTSPVGRYFAEAMKPSNKLPNYTTLLDKKGSAQEILVRAKANQTVNSGASKAAKAGKACLVVSIGVSLYNVATVEEGQRIHAAVREAGGFTGAVAGAWAVGETLGAAGTYVGWSMGWRRWSFCGCYCWKLFWRKRGRVLCRYDIRLGT